MKRFIILVILLLPVMGNAQTNWTPVTSNVSFKIKNAGLTVNGHFTGLTAELKFSPDKLATSHLQGSVVVSTINTGINMRDKDLQHEKYFDARAHKLIDVSSTNIYKKGAQYAGMFVVTMKGVRKEIEIPFTFIQKGDEATFSGTFTINRRDFGVGGRTLTMADDAVVTIVIIARNQERR